LAAKAELEDAPASIGSCQLPAITRMLGDFMQHQAEQPRSQFCSHFLHCLLGFGAGLQMAR